MAVERGMTVDIGEFDRLMENDRKISEAAEASRKVILFRFTYEINSHVLSHLLLVYKGGSTKDLTMEAEQTAWLLNSGIEITDSSRKYHRDIDLQAKVVACFQVNSL